MDSRPNAIVEFVQRISNFVINFLFSFQTKDGMLNPARSRGLGNWYKNKKKISKKKKKKPIDVIKILIKHHQLMNDYNRYFGLGYLKFKIKM